MANTNNLVKFLTGSESVLSGTSAPAKVPGQILFAIEEKTNQPPRGYIYFDKDNNTRIRMSEHATTAETDINGKEITSYVASLEVSGTSLKYKNANGDVIDTLTLQDTNTDTKVTNTASTTETKIYITGTKTSKTNTGTQFFSSSIYLDTKNNKIIAPTFVGALTGNADSATLATRAVGDESGASIKSYIKDITTQPTNHKMVVKNGNGDVINATTTTLPFVLQTGDTMTGNLTISNSDPLLKIVNTGTGAASLELQRTGASTAGWKFLNSAGTLHIQNDYTTTKGNYFDVMTLAFNTGNAVFKGTITANNGAVSVTPTLIGTASRAVADQNGGEITTKYVKYDTIVVDPDAHSLNYQNGAGDTLDIPISLPFVKLSGDTVEGTLNVTELNAGNLIVSGVGRFANGLYGNLTGNADTATRATADEGGTNIKTGYAHSLTLSGQTLTLKSGGGDNLSTVTFTTANGGTGHAGNYTAKGIIFATSATEFASTAAGAAGYLLQGNGASNDPSWIQATNANTASTIVKRDASGNFSAGTITATLSGTATNANNLLQNTRMDYGWNGVNYFNIAATNQSKAKVNDTPSSKSTWWHILRFNHANTTGYYTDLAVPFNANSLHYKRINGGTLQNSTTNGGWVQVLDQLNYNNYAPTKTGTGASGTWGISVTGNAGTATKFNSARSIALTGDVTGSASGDGTNGWSIATTVADNSHNHDSTTIVPIETKTYTNVIASANDEAKGQLYFIKILPDSYNGQWSISYRVTATIAGVSEANGSGSQTSEVYINGMRNTYAAYKIWNNTSDTSYRPYYYHCLYRAKKAGITGGYGHAMGINLRYSWNPTTATNARTVKFEILETIGCTATLLDTPLIYANFPGTGSTNYDSYTNFDGATQGCSMTGDRNDVNYQNREYYPSRKTGAVINRYNLAFTKGNNRLIGVANEDNVVAKTKTYTTESFDPFGEIYYFNRSSSRAANTNLGNGELYRQLMIDLRYSFNCGGYDTTSTLTAREPLYLVCVPQTDGQVKLNSDPISQTLPTSDNGLIYIYLGTVYEDTNPYRLNLSLHHPVYWYKNGSVRQYTNYANHAITADNATNDGDGNAITSTYLKKSGDTATGSITVSKAGEAGLYAYNTTAAHQVGLVAGASTNAGVWDTTNGKWIVYSDINGNVTLNGNANTATKFASAQSITLTGDTTGTASSQAGWGIATITKKLTNSGRLVSANIDNSDATYLNKITYFLATSSMTEGKPPTDAGILNFAWDNHKWGSQLAIIMNSTPHVYLRGSNNDTSSWDTNWLTMLDSNNYNNYAPTKTGTGATGTWGISITGSSAKLGTTTVGSATKPIYLNGGTATECSTYAGGTLVTLNGTQKDASTASFYAPTGAGTSGQILKSSGGAPAWINVAPSVTIGAGTSTATPTINITVLGASATAQSITKATTGVFGATKLSSTSSSTEEGLAATPKGVWAAIDTIKYKVTQTGNNENKEFPILLKNTNNTTDETATVKFNKTANMDTTINPSIGMIGADSFRVAKKVKLEYDTVLDTLNFVFV